LRLVQDTAAERFNAGLESGEVIAWSIIDVPAADDIEVSVVGYPLYLQARSVRERTRELVSSPIRSDATSGRPRCLIDDLRDARLSSAGRRSPAHRR
jgi:hypothetical protein